MGTTGGIGEHTSASDVSRRTFVRGAAGALALTLAPPLFADAVASAAGSTSSSRATFDACVGQPFRLRSATGLRSLDLFKVRDLRSAGLNTPNVVTGDSFSALFRGPVATPLAQGVYVLDHRRTGPLELLLAPMQAEADARYYEAIFNRATTR